MKKFFFPNLDSRGRRVRGVGGGLLVIGGAVVCNYSAWTAVAMILSGGFLLFEAMRGWCLMRACGIRTKL